jgi:hypothetical protein
MGPTQPLAKQIVKQAIAVNAILVERFMAGTLKNSDGRFCSLDIDCLSVKIQSIRVTGKL